MTYLALLILSLCLSRVQFMVAKKNIGMPWNGYGAIAGVVNRSSLAPMVYRVLVPWVIGRKSSLWKYELCQIFLMFAMLSSIYSVWGTSITLISATLFTLTFWYDYWDWMPEIIGLTLALTPLPLAAFGVVLFSLSRETAPLAGLVYALHSGDWIGGVGLTVLSLMIMSVIRYVQGKHKLYCDRWMYAANARLLASGNIGAWGSVLLCALGLVGAWGRPEFLVVPVIVAARWLMAKADETRVFATVVPYAAMLIGRWI